MNKYDVVIAGAGPAGIGAALEAARSGLKTALIERYGCVGGNLTLG
ncbi:MAG: FAD-dependent oxidoreductase [Clostridia bacterium]|nr:FAD-dependent oxidoreductase [Clostridia bacterium]